MCLNSILKAINIHIISPALTEKTPYSIFLKTRVNLACYKYICKKYGCFSYFNKILKL